jgi:Tol biopolymer transport system component
MRRAVTLLVLIVTMSVLLAPPSGATVHGDDGRIAFRTYLNEAHTWGAITTVRADGSGLRRITHPRREILDAEPDWSPDGRWIVYSRYREGHSAIFKIRRDGSHRQRLLTCPPEGSDCEQQHLPSWSPNGDRIAFTRESEPAWKGPRLWVMRADGSHLRQITDGLPRYSEFGPQWSARGGRLVFERFDEVRQLSAVFTVHVDGTHLRRLTPWRMDAGEPSDWSPNGRWIVFLNRSWSTRPSTLWLVHPDGRGLRRITTTQHGTITWYSSSFSPSGRWITASRKPWDHGNPDVLVLSLDGSVVRNLTRSPGRWESFPDWGARPQR